MSLARKAFEHWMDDYALKFEPNYSKATEHDCWAAFLAGLHYGERHPWPQQPFPTIDPSLLPKEN